MFLERDDLATKSELFSVRDDLKDEISGLRMEMTEFKSEIRSEVSQLRTEMNLKFATKDDLAELKRGFDTSFHSYVRTFIAVQAGTVVGLGGIVYRLTRLL